MENKNKLRSALIALGWHLVEYLLLFFCRPTATDVLGNILLGKIISYVAMFLPIVFWVTRYILKKNGKWHPLGTQIFVLVAAIHVVCMIPFSSLYTWAAYLPWVSDVNEVSFMASSQRSEMLWDLGFTMIISITNYSILIAIELITALIKKLNAWKKEA